MGLAGCIQRDCFNSKKGDAKRVVSSLKGSDFLGKRVFSEIADPDRDYAKTSSRRNKKSTPDRNETENANNDQFKRKDRRYKKGPRRKK